MKILTTAIVLTLCNLNASQFLSIDDLEKSLSLPEKLLTAQAVGTVLATNVDTETAPHGTSFDVSTGTCFALSKRHFITTSHTLRLIENPKDCFISMASFLSEKSVLSTSFKKPLYLKVKNITFEPNGENLAILELYEDLKITPLALGQFKQGPVIGISTAAPDLMGNPGRPAKLRHTFSYSGLQETTEKTLESWLVVPTTVTPDVVLSHAITSKGIAHVGYDCTSIFTTGDDGAPILQGDQVVAVCNGWSLRPASLEKEDVHLLANKFTVIEPYREWIESIVSAKERITFTELDEEVPESTFSTDEAKENEQ